MIFITERLQLRPWRESDAESCFQYAKNPQVGPIAGWPVHTSVEDSRNIIRNVLAVPETYAVCRKEDSQAIGSIGLLMKEQSNMEIEEDECEIGYWLGVPFWGNGYIPEAVDCILQYAFTTLQCKKVWCGYFEGNEKSKRVQEKCGFRYHHTSEQVEWKLMNDIRTEHITCLTKEEYIKGNHIWKQLYRMARGVQNDRKVSGYVEAGCVGAAILASSGKIYTGVCVDTCSTLGICAERNAIFNMLTNGDDKIEKVLAVLPDGRTGAPCGACRELMVQLMPDTYADVEIMVDYETQRIMTLGELTPEWWI